MILTKHQLKIIPRIQRKYNVSIEFLKSNLANIEKFLWYALSPRLVIKRIAIRKGNKQRVILNYYHLRRVLFDQAERKVIKTRRRNVQQWSRQMVSYLRKKYGIKEHIEITSLNDNLNAQNEAEKEKPSIGNLDPEDVSKQLKQQLELLRSGKRIVPLMESEPKPLETIIDKVNINPEELNQSDIIKETPSTASVDIAQSSAVLNTCHNNGAVLDKTEENVQNTIETTPEKQIMGSVEARSEQPKHIYKADKNIHADNETVKSSSPFRDNNSYATSSKTTSRSELLHLTGDNLKKPFSVNGNFLDMLINKVRGKNILTEISGNVNVQQPLFGTTITAERNVNQNQNHESEQLTDSGEEFFGFDETERLPGMMLTPLVPFSAQSKGGTNGAFVSESLNEFMRENLLENSNYVADGNENTIGRRHRQATLDGLVTPDCIPPRIEKPLVPESLQKLRTVAERRQYLQKFNRNHKLSIINNEAAICRELQRKVRHQKSKSVSQQMLQAPNSQMPFTRQGWQAASFVTTEFNHYYYQTLKVFSDGKEQECVRLPGVRGNNEERSKQTYQNMVPKSLIKNECDARTCGDALVWRDLKPLKTEPNKKRLNESPLPTVFKPCPLSHKPFQKPLDDESAPLLLGGSSMAVVRMPIVELEVFPAIGKPLHEVAKRYLEYILPHGDITREWAEFSVSTLQQSTANCIENDNTSNQSDDKLNVLSVSTESFSFPIPYINDRSHILVRRLVDRSEKLDETFELTTSPIEDFFFRKGINESDVELMKCADVLSEMINSVALSCSENSLIKIDPDGVHNEDEVAEMKNDKIVKDEKYCSNKIASDESKFNSQAVANKKQNRLLLELRRLNATIIDAAVKAEKGTKPCTKEYCVLGCVCQSLADDYPLRQHCGKSKCVIECACKGTQSRIMRLETDGRSITTEDAFMLRRKATARLARMEKEFTSTIVLTENETLLINESQYDKKRRCTKAPKRYEDCADTDDDYTGRPGANVSPIKTQNTAVVAIETATDTTLNSGFSETTTELREPIYVKDTVLEKLQHSTVPLIRFEGCQNMAVWCMVHELYKCYCGGRSTEGKPLVIEKDNNTTTSNAPTSKVSIRTASIDREFTIPSTKARYSFEKVEEEFDNETDNDSDVEKEKKEETREMHTNIRKRKSTDRKSQGSVVKYIITEDEETESGSENEELEDSTGSEFDGENCRSKRLKMISKRLERRGRPSEINFINKYFNTDPDSCRRTVALPRKTYLRLNRKRRSQIEEFIAKHENKQTVLLLNEHILRSVYYHKHELEKQRKELPQELTQSRNKRKLNDEGSAEVESVSKKASPTEQAEQVQTKQLNEKEQQIVHLTDDESCQSSLSSLISTSSDKPKPKPGTKLKKKSRRQRQKSLSGQSSENIAKEFDKDSVVEEDSYITAATTSKNSNDILINAKTSEDLLQEKIISSNQQSDNESILNDDVEPPISSASADKLVSDSVATDINSVGSECSAAISLNMQASSSLSRTRIDFFRDVVRSMNSLVNKKMQDIGLALKRESKVIPAPNNEILCIIKWSNFLDAFIEGFVFIWQVKLRDDQTFFAATISNIMPMVLNAVGVVNIEALPVKQLPLLGQMLKQRCRTLQTCDLAIVMQGRAKYWLVKGFLRADKSSACAKPTPKSHPLLTRKINVLSSLLAKQHIRELNKKAAQKQKEQSPDSTEVEEIPSTSRAAESANLPQQSLLKQKPPSPVNRNQKVVVSAKNSNSNNHKSISNRQKKISNQNRNQPKKLLQSTMDHCPVPASTMRKTANSYKDKSKPKVGVPLLQELISNNTFLPELKTNIDFRKVTQVDVEELQGLDITTEPHRWLVLDMFKDFSHIYVPDFQELVSLDRIQKVMAFSRQKQKIVKLQFFKNAAYDAFVTPASERKIYFGPLKLHLPPPSLILLQSVDGKIMLRESYQQMHKIQEDTFGCTTAFWIIRKNGEVNFDFNIVDGTTNNSPNVGELLPKTTQQSNSAESDEDDCMIVEMDETRVPFSLLEPKSQPNIAVKSLAELQSQNYQAAMPVQRTNFTIQTNSNSNRLQITTLGVTTSATETEKTTTQFKMLPNATDCDILTCTQIPLIPLNLPMNTQLMSLPSSPSQQPAISLAEKDSNGILCGLPPHAVITSVASAPQEASFGTTIFISNLPSTITTDSNDTQFTDKQITTVTQPNAYISPTPVLSNSLANNNSTTNQPTFGGTSNVRYITPDVRVTATGDSDAFSTPAITTVSTSNGLLLPTTQQQINTSQELISSDTPNQPLIESVAKITAPIERQQQTFVNAQSSPNAIADDWKRFLSDGKSKSSTIGSTTITKMVEKLEYAVNNGLPTNGLQIPLNLEEDDFEPVASIVFKPKVTPTTYESQKLVPKLVNINNGHNNPLISKATATVTTSTTTTTTPAKVANIKVVPVALSKSINSTESSKSPIPKSTIIPPKAKVMTLPLRKLAPLPELNKLKPISGAKIVAKSTSLPYNNSASRIYTNTATLTSTTAAISKTARLTAPKATALNQSLVQQLKIPLQPIKTYGSRLSLPSTTSLSRTSATTTTATPTTSAIGGSAPKPLINVRPAVPITQRFNAGSPQTKRYSDSSLLATTLANKKVSGVKTVNAVTTTTASLASRPSVTITSRTSLNINNNNSLNNSVSKFDKKLEEQYGVFCSSTSDSSPRFWAKRVKNSYIIKVPGLSSVVHRSDLESVNVYLNQHLMSQSPAMKSKLPIKWKFVPSDQLNLPIKMLTTNKDGTTSEKVLVRRFKTLENGPSASKAVSSNIPVCNLVKDVTATTLTPEKKCSETILIED